MASPENAEGGKKGTIMRAVVTRVSEASVTIEEKLCGRINNGFLVLLGIGPEDTEALVEKLAEKICNCRVFEDEAGKMNLSLAQVGGQLLIISQFTLYADLKKDARDFRMLRTPGWQKNFMKNFWVPA